MNNKAIQRIRQTWTEEEIDTLKKLYGTTTMKHLTKILKKSEATITRKAKELFGTSDIIEVDGFFRPSDIADILGVEKRTVNGWIKNRNFPAKKSKRKGSNTEGNHQYFIDATETWKWLKDNRNSINLTNIKRGELLPEPEWFLTAVKTAQNIKPPKNWTPEEDEYAWFLWQGGTSYREIAKFLGRPEAGTQSRLTIIEQQKGVKHKRTYFPAPANKWTDEEKERAWILWKSGKNYREIAKSLGRPETSTQAKLTEIKKQKGIPTTKPFDWTPEKEEKVLVLWQEGAEYCEIAKEMGTTVRVVQKKIGEVKKKKEIPPRNSNKWTTEKEEKALSLWQEGVEYCEIAKEMGTTVRVVQKKIGEIKKEKGIPKFKNWSLEEEEKVLSLWQEGVHYSQIAKEMGKTDTSIQEKLRRICKERGIIYKTTNRLNGWTREEEKKALSLLEKGIKCKEIAESIGKSVRSTRDKLRKLRTEIE